MLSIASKRRVVKKTSMTRGLLKQGGVNGTGNPSFPLLFLLSFSPVDTRKNTSSFCLEFPSINNAAAARGVLG